MVSDVNPEQRKNALCPIEVTDDGIHIDIKAEQP
jgi:hypothetical protein